MASKLGAAIRSAGALALLLLLPSLSCTRQQPDTSEALARTRSPHGSIDIACGNCHAASGWTPLREDVQFDHAQETPFALDGSHAEVACRSCHLQLRFDEPHAGPGECAACHVDVHAGRLGSSCTACHDTRSFAVSGRRDAHAGTAFPLTGRHRQIECEACHATGDNARFAPLPTECVTCHVTEYRAALPDHDGAGFSTGCQACHGMFSWSGARFEHLRNTGFALEGAHVRIDCNACHAPPNFALRFTASSPRDCVGCHRADYDRAHPNLGFATDCTSCHTVDTFRGARFAEHDARFPIYSGEHARRWNTCAQCHTGQGFATVSCLTCHEHSRDRMDDKHKNQPGYSYTTPACLNCHPRGRKQ